ncbi:MAG: outer membrane beta-barrel protein [Chitinophagaceae bacterium]|nr:outer membrane beta-barrel protein [Chitinophagaceae bacterium]
MRKIYLILSLLLLGGVITASAQKKITGTIKGKLVDSVNKEPMAGATVTVMNPKDSSVVSFKVANAKGEFEIGDLEAGLYRLLVSFQGFDNYSKNFMISAAFPEVNLNSVYMLRKGTTLQEVVVEGPPIQVKKDTVEFRASAFKVKPNANAEDILKKLPGVQVDKDGNVVAQGENVQKVYVDGKEFFGTDPKLATKNITADMIESIQVFDDMSDQAKFTKIDDGSRSKTINIKLKKDKRKGYFGRIMGGYGTDDRYETSLSFNKFNGDNRISILAGSNNINKRTFSFNDIVSSMGGFGSRGGGGMGGGAGFGGGGGGGGGFNVGSFGGNAQAGINRATNAGLNYSNKFNGKVDVQGSYFFSQTNTRNERSSLRQTFYTSDSTAEQSSESQSTSMNRNHRFNIRVQYEIDSMNSILLTSNFTKQNSESHSYDTSFTMAHTGAGDFLGITGSTRNDNVRDGYGLNNNILFRHKFGKIGRTFTLGYNNSINNSTGNGQNLSPFTYYNSDGSINFFRNQDLVSEQETKSANNVVSASYTEPFGKNKLLEVNYAYTNRNSTSDRKVYDYNSSNGKYDQLNLAQTNFFENDFIASRAGMNFRVQTKMYNWQIGGAIEQSSIESRSKRALGPKDTTYKATYTNFFPQASFQYTFKQGKNLRFRYNGRTNQPSVTQLQDVPDVSNPLQIVTGNPALKQEFTNNANLSYSTFNMASFKYLNANLSFSNTTNKIVNTISINGPVQTIRPENLNGAYNASSFITLGLPLRNMKGSNFNFNNVIRYKKDVSLVDTNRFAATNFAKNITKNFSITQTVGINFDLKQKANLGINASIAYNDVAYTLRPNQNQKYYTQTYSADISYMGLKNWVFATDFDYYINTGRGAGFNQTIPMWNASIAHQLFKKKNGELKVSVNDLLNQNQAIARNVGDNYIEDTRQLVIKRYFLLTFTYNLSKGQRQQTGMPNMGPGMERQMQRTMRAVGPGGQ